MHRSGRAEDNLEIMTKMPMSSLGVISGGTNAAHSNRRAKPYGYKIKKGEKAQNNTRNDNRGSLNVIFAVGC